MCSKESGALSTQPDMRLAGRDRAWAIGDCARIMNAVDGAVCPTTGQFAERQGRQVADNIVRTIRGEATKPFSYRPQGQLCAIGGRNAVAEIRGVHLSGFIAVVGVANRVSAEDAVLGPSHQGGGRLDVGAVLSARSHEHPARSRLNASRTRSTGRATTCFIRAIRRRTSTPLEKGEVEVLRRPSSGDRDDLIAQLGPGDFFGEMALLEHGRAARACAW